MIGQGVDGVQLAQHLAYTNEIVLSWNCWKLCEQYIFEVEIMKENEAVKVRDWPIHCTSYYIGQTLVRFIYCLTGTLFWREARVSFLHR